MSLKTLKIQNLVLIESAEISFGPDLNIITGETGSGKSVLLAAIRLLSGGRAEANLIRKGAEFAVVEALLDDDIHIRREIYRSGKNRCFIDESQVTLSALKDAIGIELVSQNSSSSLFEQQKLMLDSFGKLESFRKEIESSIAKEKELTNELNSLKSIPRERELEWAKQDLMRIEKINFSQEEDLTNEHNLLTHSQDLREKVSAVSFALTESKEIPNLKKAWSLLEQAASVDPKLKLPAESMKTALLELDEVGSSAEAYAAAIDVDPKRLEFVETSLSEIDSLKKRFGNDIEKEREKLSDKVDRMIALETTIEEKEKELALLKNKNEKEKTNLTTRRKEAALPFQKLIVEELYSLNLPEAKFKIHVGETFNDLSFLFSANPGQEIEPLALCASGGELSRILLVIKTILSSGTSTLVFDEIDSNVGGHTAFVLGQKLKKLASNRQVITVTHFVQVAKCAGVHFLVSKKVQGQSAYTFLRKLNEKEKEIEYSRMLGQGL